MLSGISREDKVKVSYKPAQELIILEMVEYDLRQLAETCTLLMNAGRPVILTWADGVAYSHTPLPFNTKDLLKDRMNGKIYWASVMYASMPVYHPVIKVGVMDVPVVSTPNPVLRQVATWLRSRMENNS